MRAPHLSRSRFAVFVVVVQVVHVTRAPKKWEFFISGLGIMYTIDGQLFYTAVYIGKCVYFIIMLHL